jgi:hypothetical protein
MLLSAGKFYTFYFCKLVGAEVMADVPASAIRAYKVALGAHHWVIYLTD